MSWLERQGRRVLERQAKFDAEPNGQWKFKLQEGSQINPRLQYGDDGPVHYVKLLHFDDVPFWRYVAQLLNRDKAIDEQAP